MVCIQSLRSRTRGSSCCRIRRAYPVWRSPDSARPGAPRTQSRVEAESWENVDRNLFERLRSVRLEIARSRGVPPYVIFHDATLREMARLRPTSIDALLAVKGVGARKADDLGGVFLDAIRAHA